MNENQQKKMLENMDAAVENVMKQWNVEGLSLGIVDQGRVLLEKGYGWSRKEEKTEMTAHTVLPIGSATKSFTTLVLEMLADEGKLDLDVPVRTYIPWLKLYNEEMTENVTTRDLLCHRTGVPKYDAAAVFCTDYDRKKMVEGLKYFQPSAGLRSLFQYSNQMVMLAGYLVEVLTGMSWEEAVKKRILDKLGMKRTDFFVEQMEEKYPDCSCGYLFNGTENIRTEYLSLKGIGPAGAVISTAEDMNRYLLFQLGDGSWEGERLVSAERMKEMHSVQMHGSPYLWKLPEIEKADYGLCWFVDRYRGNHMVSHGGNTLGFSSLMMLLPEQKFGVSILTNANSSFSVNDLAYRLADEVLGVEETDWTQRLKTEVGKLFGAMADGAGQHEAARITGTEPAHPLNDYAGIYTHPAFGELKVEADENGLSGSLNGFEAVFNHYHYEVYDMLLPLMGLNLPARFQTDWNGQVNGVEIVLEGTPRIAPALFERKE